MTTIRLPFLTIKLIDGVRSDAQKRRIREAGGDATAHKVKIRNTDGTIEYFYLPNRRGI